MVACRPRGLIAGAAVALAHIGRACRQPVALGFSLFELFTAHATYYAAAQAGRLPF